MLASFVEKNCVIRSGNDGASTLTGCYFFCFSKSPALWIPSRERDPRRRESNLRRRRISLRLKEKETEIETHLLGQLTHKPEISAGMNAPIETHSTIGRNLNASDHAAYPHRHRFPEPGSMIAQSFISAHSYRNRLRCAAAESSRALNSGAT